MKEQKRLEAQRLGTEDWQLWGPYLSERAWGTVRENGALGLGASHQTGWSGLVANLIKRHYTLAAEKKTE